MEKTNPKSVEDLVLKAFFVSGKMVCLRPLEEADLNERYLGWLNDPDVNRYLESGIFPYTNNELNKFYEQSIGSRDQVILAVVEKRTDEHIGNVKLGPINWVHRKAVFGILIGEKRFWGMGMATEATRLAVEYAFFRLNLRRIELGVHAEHESAVRVYEKVGFKTEGRMREVLFHEGKYKDSLWMGLLRTEFERSI
jgi:RimJ/RimL family protein N-acetyltransferase